MLKAMASQQNSNHQNHDLPVPASAVNQSHQVHLQTRRSYFRLGLVLFVGVTFLEPAQADVSFERQAELRHLLKQDCGSCHGLTLKGGLGPALTAEVIASKPKPLLYTTILEGRPGTPMPPFRNLLTEEEIHWLVELLYKGDV